MAISKYVSGINTSFSTQLNANFAEGYVMECKNHIRQLIDRAGVYSSDGTDLWGEAYIDANGRNDCVVTGSTDAVFNVNKYQVDVTLGSTETENHAVSASTTAGDIVSTITIINSGFFTSISCGATNSSEASLVIRDASSNILLSKSRVYDGSGDQVWTLTPTE
jgi:hypothetical protein